MGVKKLRPITPGQRHRIAPTFDEITKKTPEKSLLAPLKSTGGRNNTGKMTMRNRGGGHKKRYRIIDFKRQKYGVKATVIGIEYDPNRNARIALLEYADGEKAYMIAPEGVTDGHEVVSGPDVAPEVGNSLPLSAIPVGTIVHNIELRPGKGAVMVRGAGGYAQLLGRSGKYASIKLPSGETRLVLQTCYATIGTVSNSEFMNIRLGKAGRKRWLGRRPRTRPMAMNPVDHPMGGGEGRSGGGQPRSRNGIYSKGQKTRKANKYSDRLIINRKKSKR